MKHLFHTLTLTIIAVAALTACKPSVDTYRQAYESAVAKRDAKENEDSTIYNRFREMARNQLIPLGNDTLEVRTEHIGYTTDGGASRYNVHRYLVVAGRFKQVFNARQMRERLQGMGYDSAMIVHTREPLYYVVTASETTAQGALDALRAIEADKRLSLKAPLPFVLQPAHLSR